MVDISLEVDKFIGFMSRNSSIEFDIDDNDNAYLTAKAPDDIFRDAVNKFWDVMLIADVWHDENKDRYISLYIPHDDEDFYE